MSKPKSSELELHDPFEIPADPKKIPYGVRASMAFELRKAGAPYDLIAEKLGYKNGESCRQAIIRVIKERFDPDDVDEVMRMELARLDALQLVAWKRAQNGDLAAIDRILKIMERRADYLGLSQRAEAQAASTVNQTAIFIGGSETDYVEQLQQVRGMVEDARKRAIEVSGNGG